MDAMLRKKAKELAGSAATVNDLIGTMRSLMKTEIEAMLHLEMSVHWGRGRAIVVAETEKGEKTVIYAV